jgi:anion-transporting  ArsA/GET3 family ATPase
LNPGTLEPYCPPVQRLLFVTGKGGVGKTTVAAALAQRMAQRGQRVLLVEMAADRSLAALFGHAALSTEPARLAIP